MFFPFIPYLVVLGLLSALLATPPLATGGEAAGWGIALLFAALPLLGGIVGNLPFRDVAGRHRLNGTRKRMLFLALWLGVLAVTGLPRELAGRLEFLAGGSEAALAVLLLNYWLGDTLSLHAYHPFRKEAAPGGESQWRRYWITLRMPAPILVLILFGLWTPLLGGGGIGQSEDGLPGQLWLESLGSLVAMMTVAMVAVPLLIRYCWGLQPLPSSESERVIREELQANGVSVAHVLAWPEEMTGFATAGVIGLLPPLRYILFSPSLVAALDEEELRSVTAHEAGHLKHLHLWFFLATIFGFLLFMQALAAGLFWAGLIFGLELPLWSMIAFEIAALLVFFRYGVGFLSRYFERQADGNALRRIGPGPFEGAISKVARLNGIPVEKDNWHHHGIGQRIAYSRSAGMDPAQLLHHDRRVNRIKLALMAFLVTGFLLQGAMFSEGASNFLGERYLAKRIEGLREPGEPDLPGLRFLASRAFSRNEHDLAERYFRLILIVTPEDPRAQNNLAWVLVTRPEPDRQGLEEGLSLALLASRADRAAYIWDTLAESYFRMNQIGEAIAAAEEALLLATAGEGRGDVPLEYYRGRLADFTRFGKGA